MLSLVKRAPLNDCPSVPVQASYPLTTLSTKFPLPATNLLNATIHGPPLLPCSILHPMPFTRLSPHDAYPSAEHSYLNLPSLILDGYPKATRCRTFGPFHDTPSQPVVADAPWPNSFAPSVRTHTSSLRAPFVA